MKNEKSVGSDEDAPGRRAVQTRGPAPGRHQPASRVANVAGAERLRRRLSSIFQRPMSGIASRPRAARTASGTRPEDPGQQLPVAADPAVLARGGHLVVAREAFEELDVGNEARRARRGPRRDRGRAACSPAPGRRARARTRPRRRCPCPCRSPRRRGPGRRRTPRRRRGRCRGAPRRRAGRACPSPSPAASASPAAGGSRARPRRGRPPGRRRAGSAGERSCRPAGARLRAAGACRRRA